MGDLKRPWKDQDASLPPSLSLRSCPASERNTINRSPEPLATGAWTKPGSLFGFNLFPIKTAWRLRCHPQPRIQNIIPSNPEWLLYWNKVKREKKKLQCLPQILTFGGSHETSVHIQFQECTRKGMYMSLVKFNHLHLWIHIYNIWDLTTKRVTNAYHW